MIVLKQKNLLVGISGSIVSVSIHDYLFELKKTYNCNIKVILTENASRMINPNTILYFSDEVFTDLFDSKNEIRIPHVHLTEWADIMLIIPATANIIGKISNGIADDLLSLTAMAAKCPIILFPNMNPLMFERKAVQRNLATLKDDGYLIVEAEEEAIQLSTGEKVKGIMPTPSNFIYYLEKVIS